MTKRLRLLSANLWYGCADPEALAEQVERLAVDALAVQELGRAQARAIERVLPYGKLEPADDYSGMGIALRRPGEVRRLPLPTRDARVVELDPLEWPDLGRRVELVNVHLQAPHSSRPWRNLAIRRGQVRALVRYLDEVPHAARAVLGDLNATPLWPAYRRLAERLHDAVDHVARARGERPARTWGPWCGSPRLFRIDHVLTHGVTATHTEAIHIEGSDHSGLLVDVTLEGPDS